jgi:hypothetical protein
MSISFSRSVVVEEAGDLQFPLTIPPRRYQSGVRQGDDDVSRGPSSVIAFDPAAPIQPLTIEVPAEQNDRRSPG